MRKNARRQVRNLRDKRELHDLILEFRTLAKNGKKDEAAKIFVTIQKKLDKAAKAWLTKNAASRRKSRLAAVLNKATVPAKKKK